MAGLHPAGPASPSLPMAETPGRASAGPAKGLIPPCPLSLSAKAPMRQQISCYTGQH
jgi:hypothetical protein